uniref:Oxysterol-binding protein n=1 Tax=Ornithorhynchus anatinus TaxID=9258 RepID=A0A6I8PG51_ORNAN
MKGGRRVRPAPSSPGWLPPFPSLLPPPSSLLSPPSSLLPPPPAAVPPSMSQAFPGGLEQVLELGPQPTGHGEGGPGRGQQRGQRRRRSRRREEEGGRQRQQQPEQQQPSHLCGLVPVLLLRRPGAVGPPGRGPRGRQRQRQQPRLGGAQPAQGAGPGGRAQQVHQPPPGLAEQSTPSFRSRSLTLLPPGTPNSASPSSQRHLNPGAPSVVTITHHKSPAAARKVKNQCAGQLHEVREMMSQVEGQQKNLVQAIESLPGSGPITALDQDLLLLKATSAATLSCLGECLNLLQQSMHQVGQHSQKTVTSENILGWQGPKSHSSEQLKNGALGSLPSANTSMSWAIIPTMEMAQDCQTLHPDPEDSGPQLIPVEDEVTDTEDNEEEDLGVLEDQRSIILHLISQLKLGMDLTRVVLPTFILEKRSLLEMFANFMAHPDLFLSIAAGATPEERVISFVEYYLTSFHEGRKGAVAKKPYNPIIGETFHCSWHVPRDKVTSHRTSKAPLTVAKAQAGLAAGPEELGRADGTEEWGRVAGTEERDLADGYKLSFVAEQVSHHPPVSCFYCECKEKRICVNTHVWTKSKFMGMSIGVSMVGEGVLNLLEHEEEYVFTLPSAYARSILTVPWVELGGKVNINCAKTGYSATVTFHTKPFYGGKVHRVTAEVKHNPTNTIVCKAQGEWNGTLEFTYSNGETKVIDTTALPVIPKKIRPVAKQGPFESRHLWQHVTSSLKSGNIDAATKYKHHLEERQRTEEKQRAAVGAPWQPKYFTKEVKCLSAQLKCCLGCCRVIFSLKKSVRQSAQVPDLVNRSHLICLRNCDLWGPWSSSGGLSVQHLPSQLPPHWEVSPRSLSGPHCLTPEGVGGVARSDPS